MLTDSVQSEAFGKQPLLKCSEIYILMANFFRRVPLEQPFNLPNCRTGLRHRISTGVFFSLVESLIVLSFLVLAIRPIRTPFPTPSFEFSLYNSFLFLFFSFSCNILFYTRILLNACGKWWLFFELKFSCVDKKNKEFFFLLVKKIESPISIECIWKEQYRPWYTLSKINYIVYLSEYY